MKGNSEIQLGLGDTIDSELLRDQRRTLLGLLTILETHEADSIPAISLFTSNTTEDTKDHLRGVISLIDTLLTNRDIIL